MASVCTEAGGHTSETGVLDWSALGRLARLRTLSAVSLHFAEVGVHGWEVPQSDTIPGDATQREDGAPR